MKRYKSLTATFLISAFIFFSSEKEGLSQSHSSQGQQTAGLTSDKANGFSLAYFRTLKPLDVSNVQVVQMTSLGKHKTSRRAMEGKAVLKGSGQEKGNGVKVRKKGHGPASPQGAGNEKYGISKGAEGLRLK